MSHRGCPGAVASIVVAQARHNSRHSAPYTYSIPLLYKSHHATSFSMRARVLLGVGVLAAWVGCGWATPSFEIAGEGWLYKVNADDFSKARLLAVAQEFGYSATSKDQIRMWQDLLEAGQPLPLDARLSYVKPSSGDLYADRFSAQNRITLRDAVPNDGARVPLPPQIGPAS